MINKFFLKVYVTRQLVLNLMAPVNNAHIPWVKPCLGSGGCRGEGGKGREVKRKGGGEGGSGGCRDERYNSDNECRRKI